MIATLLLAYSSDPCTLLLLFLLLLLLLLLVIGIYSFDECTKTRYRGMILANCRSKWAQDFVLNYISEFCARRIIENVYIILLFLYSFFALLLFGFYFVVVGGCKRAAVTLGDYERMRRRRNYTITSRIISAIFLCSVN